MRERLGSFVASSVAMLLLATTLAAVATFGPLATGAAGAATTTTSFAMTTVRSSAVDPATGRVYVAGDDKVAVFEPNGTLRTTIPNVYGAAGLFVSGPDLWVTETTAGAVARIDLATETVADTFVAGMQVMDSLVVHAGLVWFTVPSSSYGTALATLDPASRQITARGGSFYRAFLRTIPGRDDRLLVGEPGLSPFSVYLVSTTGPTISVLDDVPHGVGGNLQDLVVTAGGSSMVTASGAPYVFPEFSTATMDPTGLDYPGTAYPTAVAYTPARGGLVVGGTASSRQVHVAVEGRPVAVAQLATSGDLLGAGVEVAPDGTRAYALVRGTTAGTTKLDVFDLAPAITAVSPAQAVAGVPTTVTVDGSFLGAVTGATVGGVAADATVVSPTQVSVEVPTTLAAGTHPLVLTGALGAVSRTFSVVANTGATLDGLVMTADMPTGGVPVTLRGPELAAPRTATSGPDGRFSFTGLPYGTTYSLLASDPTGAYPDVLDEGITVVPNGSTKRYLDFEVQPWTSPSIARVTLPAGTARDVEVDPVTGRVFVSIGDQVVVFDRAGTLLARLNDQFGADGLAVGGGSVWVNQRTAGRVARIDPASLAVTGSWPTTTPTTGGLAFTAGRLMFTDDDDQWVSLAVLDPATGAVQKGSGNWYAPRVTGVAESESSVLLYEVGISPGGVYVLDAAAYPPTSLRSASASGADWVASAAQDRVWTTSGRERRLSTLAETGVVYPLNGTSSAVAYTPALGGIVATGRTVSRQGVPAATHVLMDTPATRSLALDASGDRAYLMSGRTFVVWGLQPVVNSALRDAATNRLTIGGFGLGGATRVEVAGTTAAFTVDGADQLTVTLPPLPGGRHPVRVVTPWGASQTRWFEVAAGVPGPPLDVQAMPGDQSAIVFWSAPATEGGSPVTAYEVLLNGATNAQPVCTTTGARSCSVGGLVNGNSYSFVVRAANADGWGPLSTPSDPVVPAPQPTVPGPPTGVSAVAGDASATITWAAPASDGGSPISRYEVIAAATGAAPTLVCLTTEPGCTADGLTNGVGYTFSVRAVNGVGPGPYSEPSATVTPQSTVTVPGAPTSVSAVAGAGSATVSWSAPADDGGSPVTGYEVVSSPGQSTCTTTGALTCTVTGLVAGTSYTFRVRAANAVGWGALSSASNAVTPSRVATLPGAPTDVVGVAGKNQVTVSWTRPADDGGSPITGYEVAGVPAPATCTTTGATTCTVTKLSSGSAYTFQVRARNALGWGPWSSPSVPVTPKGRR